MSDDFRLLKALGIALPPPKIENPIYCRRGHANFPTIKRCYVCFTKIRLPRTLKTKNEKQ